MGINYFRQTLNTIISFAVRSRRSHNNKFIKSGVPWAFTPNYTWVNILFPTQRLVSDSKQYLTFFSLLKKFACRSSPISLAQYVNMPNVQRFHFILLVVVTSSNVVVDIILLRNLWSRRRPENYPCFVMYIPVNEYS